MDRDNPGLEDAIPLGSPGSIQYNHGYGYNELGTGWMDGKLRLGLGFTVDFSGYGPYGLPLGPRNYVKPGDLKNPSELIAIGEGATWLFPNQRPDAIEGCGSVTARHGGRANMTFGDGHVELARREKLVAESDSARRCWNNGNQPHPETW